MAQKVLSTTDFYAFLKSNNMTADQFLFLKFIADYSDIELPHTTMKTLIPISHRTIRRWAIKLEADGWMKTKKRGGGEIGNTYTILRKLPQAVL